jgi:hypothetical protein
MKYPSPAAYHLRFSLEGGLILRRSRRTPTLIATPKPSSPFPPQKPVAVALAFAFAFAFAVAVAVAVASITFFRRVSS